MTILIIIAIIVLVLYAIGSSGSSKKKTQAASRPVSPAVTIPAVFYRIKEVEIPYTMNCWRTAGSDGQELWRSRIFRVTGVTSRGNEILLCTSQSYIAYDPADPQSIYTDENRAVYRDENGRPVDPLSSGVRFMGAAPVYDEDHEYIIGTEMMFEVSAAGRS